MNNSAKHIAVKTNTLEAKLKRLQEMREKGLINEEEYQNREHIYDGIITIDKRSLVEPEIHEKMKKQPSGRKKLMTKRIPREVDYIGLITAGKINVENSKFCWQILNNGMGLIAIHIIFKIFDLYQSEGAIPETV